MKLLFNTIQTRPNSVSSQSVRSEDEEDKGKHKTHSATQKSGLTAPRSSVHSGRKIISAHTTETSGGTPTTPAPSKAIELNDLLSLLNNPEYSKLHQETSLLQAKHDLAEARDARNSETDETAKAAKEKVFRDLVTKHADILSLKADQIANYDGAGCGDLADLKANLKTSRDNLEKHPVHGKAQKVLDRLNREGLTETQVGDIAKKHKHGFGSRFWGTAAIAAAMAGLGAIGAKLLGDSSIKAAEEKAKAADDKVTALQEQIQSILQQLGQVMQAMQAKADKSINLVGRLLKLQQKSLGAASTPAHGSFSVASTSVRSDDNSAGSPTAPTGDDIAKLEKEVAALEKEQASQGSKPTSPKESSHGESQQPQPSGSGGFKMPQLPGMPQGDGNQNAGSPGQPGVEQAPPVHQIRMKVPPHTSAPGGDLQGAATMGDYYDSRKSQIGAGAQVMPDW